MSSQSFPRGAIAFALLLYLFTSSRSVAAASSYTLNTEFLGQAFFDGFDFFTGPDPTNGFVDYVNRSIAEAENLISYGNGAPAIMRVDSSENLDVGQTQGRASIRIESKKNFNHGLIISDIAHMPGDDCGIWPAYWTLGPDWPNNGEIDIIEGVNSGFGQQMKNVMSLHTSPGCTIAGSNELGQLQTNNCDTTINFSTGCGVLAQNTNSYGNAFNMANGGVYATEWTSSYIRIWFFPRASIPADITAGNPDPSQWGLPQANFQGSCTIDDKFRDHKIIFDITFCGDYAGSVFSSDAVCKKLAGTCEDYVAGSPEAFNDAFWSVNSIRVYDQVSLARITESSSSVTSLIPQNSVSAPGMGFNNSIRTSASASPTGVSRTRFGTWNYLGCASSMSGFPTFVEADNSAYSANMTIEICTSLCSANSSAYAGLYKAQCYCAASLGLDSVVTPGNPKGSLCGIPCPGDANEFCGGGNPIQGQVGSRQIQITVLLSIYVNTVVSPLVSTVAPTNPVATLTSVMPQNAVRGYGMGGGAASVISTIISISYIDVCASCPAGYTTITTSRYIQHCGCMDVPAFPSTPTIVMTTIVKSCAVCGETGGAANVTVTVPYSYCTAVQTGSSAGIGVSAIGGGCIGGNCSVNGVKLTSTAVEAGVKLTTATATANIVSSQFTGDAGMMSFGTNVLSLAVGLVLVALL